jgi:hypothetical protein
MKNPRNGNNSLDGSVNFKKKLNMKTSIKWKK